MKKKQQQQTEKQPLFSHHFLIDHDKKKNEEISQANLIIMRKFHSLMKISLADIRKHQKWMSSRDYQA